ncbi:undecaprenyl-diphosphate phosphatase [candidate division WWE3 bacterium]|uniref:Undecaprenyl-diphosphatase n=1 Tax=candidate division WWE3 bacterium TaxID=2053526 RepID=A0A955RW83_UNCKA|nr:undecaprenyl-diphosphate phosphatase [candidate division WWE3 bacterium]
MSIIEAVLLGVVQGITEFLPISSSGHLTLLQHILGVSEPPLFFNIMVHAGTLIATLIYFRQLIWQYIQGMFAFDSTTWKKVGFVVIASIPAGLIGVLLETYLEGLFDSLLIVGFGFLITALFLRQLNTNIQKRTLSKTTETMSAKDSLIIGIFQALAILPGVTRSGSTIFAGTIQKLTVEDAFDFSFLISIPAIAGALLIQLLSFEVHGSYTSTIIGGVTAAVVGYCALQVLRKMVINGKMQPFVWYCLGLSAITFIIAIL